MKKLLPFVCALVLFASCKKVVSSNPETLPNAYSDQGLGASATDILSSANYTSLNIQIQNMPGYALDPTTISNVKAYLGSICNKPGGINITTSEIAANGDTLNVDKVAILERQNRTMYTGGTTLGIYILVTDGYDTSTTTLGFAYRNTSICLFGKDVFDHSGGVGEVTRVALESTVLEHELGHLMGLVNLGSAMQVNHQDVAHGNHCSNTNCLMYYATEIHAGLGGMAAGNIPVLDANCMNDLIANGGK